MLVAILILGLTDHLILNYQNFSVAMKIIVFILIIALRMMSVLPAADIESGVFSYYCKAQSGVENDAQFMQLSGFSVAQLSLAKNEVIDGVVVSENKKIVALKIDELSSSGGANPIRIIVANVANKNVKTFSCKFPTHPDWWISDIGAADNQGVRIVANVAMPNGIYVKRQWCVIELHSMKIVEIGLNALFRDPLIEK